MTGAAAQGQAPAMAPISKVGATDLGDRGPRDNRNMLVLEKRHIPMVHQVSSAQKDS